MRNILESLQNSVRVWFPDVLMELDTPLDEEQGVWQLNIRGESHWLFAAWSPSRGEIGVSIIKPTDDPLEGFGFPNASTPLGDTLFKEGDEALALKLIVETLSAPGQWKGGQEVASESTSRMVLRTVYLPKELDDELRRRAFRQRKSKNELIRAAVQTAFAIR
ncbi:MAG: hypothetical protein JWN50_283 [Parcubacteria group bacterium]|nr:hypothetical protein [Parcubacteria group bacterium]